MLILPVVFAILFVVKAKANVDWNTLPTPTFGPVLTMPGNDVAAATLSSDDIAVFAERYKRANDNVSLTHAQRTLIENSIIPAESVTTLRSVLPLPEEPSGTSAFTRYGMTFALDGKSTVGGLTLIIDWERRVLLSSDMLSISVNGSPPPLASQSRTLEAALGFFRNHLLHEGLVPSQLRLSAVSYGKRTIILSWLPAVTLFSEAPIPIRYYMDARLTRPRIEKLDERVIARLIDTEMHPLTNDERLCAMKAYVQLHDPSAVIIRSVRDIPGHTRQPLDTDLIYAIRAPFSFTEKRFHLQYDVSVCYTYTKLGGIVRRYRLEFRDTSIARASPVMLADSIGNAETRM